MNLRMNDREKFASLVELANFRLERWKSRAMVEWRISLALWALMAASIVGIKHRPPEPLLLGVVGIVIVGHGLIWVAQMGLRQGQDIQSAFFYLDHAEKLIGMCATPREKPKLVESLSFRRRWLMPPIVNLWGNGVQTFTTILLGGAMYFLIGRNF